ncbi:glycosyltransferase family 32 protein [Floccifex sp.]|uniref:glycosyltransferase family 32 protein n=1 Tax=Floccifex sp. TaxID=2815810 RepID=UPI003EFFD6D0
MKDLKIQNNDIPKVIHYCWFGNNPLPELARKCIDSWKKFCPKYEIKEWNETNFDVNICEYTRGAYNEKKWAFVSDYARFWIIYNFGGIYMDTDVELIASIDDLIETGAYMGCEPKLESDCYDNQFDKYNYLINPGLGIAAPAHHPFYEEMLNIYNKSSFYNVSGEVDLSTVVYKSTLLLEKYGYKENLNEKILGITIYPSDYFCPKNYMTGNLIITKNTRSIHHYSASWHSKIEKKQFQTLQILISKFGNNKGQKLWKIYTLPYRLKNKVKKLGILGTILFGLNTINKKFRRKTA